MEKEKINYVQYDFLGTQGEIKLKGDLDLWTLEQLRDMCIKDYLENNMKIMLKGEKKDGTNSKE